MLWHHPQKMEVVILAKQDYIRPSHTGSPALDLCHHCPSLRVSRHCQSIRETGCNSGMLRSSAQRGKKNKPRSYKNTENHFPLFSFVYACLHKIRGLCLILWASLCCDWDTRVTGAFDNLYPTTPRTAPFSGSSSSPCVKLLTAACPHTHHWVKVLDHWKGNYSCWLCSLLRSWLECKSCILFLSLCLTSTRFSRD